MHAHPGPVVYVERQLLSCRRISPPYPSDSILVTHAHANDQQIVEVARRLHDGTYVFPHRARKNQPYTAMLNYRI